MNVHLTYPDISNLITYWYQVPRNTSICVFVIICIYYAMERTIMVIIWRSIFFRKSWCQSELVVPITLVTRHKALKFLVLIVNSCPSISPQQTVQKWPWQRKKGLQRGQNFKLRMLDRQKSAEIDHRPIDLLPLHTDLRHQGKLEKRLACGPSICLWKRRKSIQLQLNLIE